MIVLCKFFFCIALLLCKIFEQKNSQTCFLKRVNVEYKTLWIHHVWVNTLKKLFYVELIFVTCNTIFGHVEHLGKYVKVMLA